LPLVPQLPKENIPPLPKEKLFHFHKEKIPQLPKESYQILLTTSILEETAPGNIPLHKKENSPQLPKENFPQLHKENSSQPPIENIPQLHKENSPQLPKEIIPQLHKENRTQLPKENIPQLQNESSLLRTPASIPQHLRENVQHLPKPNIYQQLPMETIPQLPKDTSTLSMDMAQQPPLLQAPFQDKTGRERETSRMVIPVRNVPNQRISEISQVPCHLSQVVPLHEKTLSREEMQKASNLAPMVKPEARRIPDLPSEKVPVISDISRVIVPEVPRISRHTKELGKCDIL
jgi:hypothetical protein